MLIIASNNIVQHIKCRLKNRAYNIKKYNDWLNINATPIQTKLRVPNCCLSAAYLNGCECWWKVDVVSPIILAYLNGCECWWKVDVVSPIILADLNGCECWWKVDVVSPIILAYLNGCECWWKVDVVSPIILAEERMILKRILQVKSNAPNYITNVKLNRCDVVTKIKSKQFLPEI